VFFLFLLEQASEIVKAQRVFLILLEQASKIKVISTCFFVFVRAS